MTSLTAKARSGPHPVEKHDWVLDALVLGAMAVLPLVLQASGWVPGSIRWVWVALSAGALGLLLAQSRRESPEPWLVGVVLGLGLALVVVGGMLPPAQMLGSDLHRVWDWLWNLVVHQYRDPELPLSFSATHIVYQASDLYARLSTWHSTVRSGGASTDNAALLISVWMTVWMCSWNGAFQLGRHRRTWSALIPPGLAILASVGYTGLGIGYARLFLALAVAIAVWSNAGRMIAEWAEDGVDVTHLFPRHIFVTGLPLAALVLVLAMVIPYRGTYGTIAFVWERTGDRFTALYEQWDRAFAGRNPISRPNAQVIVQTVFQDAVSAYDELKEHDIRGGGINSDEILFRVETNDPPPQPGQPAPQRYWRERTYDLYTGTGWATSPTGLASLPAYSPWKEVGYPTRSLTQTFMRARPAILALAVNEPVVMRQNYSIRTRGYADLAAIYTEAMTYTVVSMVPDVTLSELRAAEQDYPRWVEDRFLPLPEIPDRVQDLTQRIVRGAEAATRYDKAVAIETYLRGFVYDLEVAPPADGIDVVDYYLFTTQAGYCDYAATAMVVMLRSVGVAARYASGYGQGQYNPELGAWEVRGTNAHAWVEVYFPGLGWIEFEPTPIESPFARHEVRPTPQPTAIPTATPVPTEVPEPTEEPAAAATMDDGDRSGGLRWPLRIAAGLTIVLAGAIAFSGLRAARRPQDPRQTILEIYGQLQQHAQRVDLVPLEHVTPREFLREFTARVEEQRGVTRRISRDIAFIGQLYERARYSAEAPTSDDSQQALAAWYRLRHHLIHGSPTVSLASSGRAGTRPIRDI